MTEYSTTETTMVTTSYYRKLSVTRHTMRNLEKRKREVCGMLFNCVISSRIIQFDLVCDKDALKQLSKSLSSLGLLIGAIVFGQLAEICGRKKTFHIATTLTMIFAIAVSFTPTFTFFIVGQFLLAFSSSSIYQTSIVLGMEASPSSRRPLIGTACTFSYAIGYILLGMTAYFVQGDWRTLQFITGAICLFYLPYICFLEESVRWLVQHGEAEKLEHMLIRADTLNKSTMEEHMINLHEMCSDFECGLCLQNTEPVGHASVFALFKTPILRKRSVIIIINWFAFGLMYYGISLNIDLFARDPYMIFVFTGFVEIPAGFFSGWLLARYGRRATISVAMIVSGITFLIGGVLSGVAAVLFTSTVVAKFIAKMCISGFPVYISELVPTSVRFCKNYSLQDSYFTCIVV
ncbi:organic anion transporter 3-like [Saccoglossus kowalevskii]